MKRCPFCGGYARLKPLIINSIQLKPKFKRIENPPLCWFVECGKCSGHTQGKTKIEAKKSWDKRV